MKQTHQEPFCCAGVGFFLESAWQRQLSGFLSRERHKTVIPPLQEPFLHDFLQEKNILEGLRKRAYTAHFTVIEVSFVTVVSVQISR
jgi:hypothetical protein